MFTFFLVCWVGYQILISNVNSLVRKEEAVVVAWLRYPEPILLLTICGVLWCFHWKVMKLARATENPLQKKNDLWFYDFLYFTICGLNHVQSTLCYFFKVLVVNLIEHYTEDCWAFYCLKSYKRFWCKSLEMEKLTLIWVCLNFSFGPVKVEVRVWHFEWQNNFNLSSEAKVLFKHGAYTVEITESLP